MTDARDLSIRDGMAGTGIFRGRVFDVMRPGESATCYRAESRKEALAFVAGVAYANRAKGPK